MKLFWRKQVGNGFSVGSSFPLTARDLLRRHDKGRRDAVGLFVFCMMMLLVALYRVLVGH